MGNGEGEQGEEILEELTEVIVTSLGVRRGQTELIDLPCEGYSDVEEVKLFNS